MDTEIVRRALEGRSVLVIDDNHYLRDVVRAIFELEGAIVFEAATVREAQALLESHTPDAIVTDLELGSDRGGGIEILQHVKRRMLTAAVVLFTGRGIEYEEVCSFGFDAVLLKPSSTDALVSTIVGAVGRARRTATRVMLPAA